MHPFNNGNGKLSTLAPGVQRAIGGLSTSRFIKPDQTINRFLSYKEFEAGRELAERVSGPIKCGFVNDSEMIFGFRPEDSQKIVLAIGSPGVGKTYLLRVLMEEFLENSNCTIIYFDRKGTEKCLFPHLCGTVGKEQVLFLSPERNLCENPFSSPHPNIQAQQWYRMVCNILSTALDIRAEAGNALTAAALKASRELNGSDPCLFDIYPCLVSLRPKRYDERVKADYYARSEFRLEMCLINLPNVFCYRRGIPFEEYRKKRFILIDLSKTDDFSSKIIVESLVSKIINCQLAEARENDLSWVLFFDEAEYYYSQSKINTFAGLSPLEQYIRMARSTGVWQFLANQSYSTLSFGAKAMAGCKIIFKLDGSELKHIAEAFNLKKEELDIINSLKTREAIVRLDSRAGTPIFKLTVPAYRIKDDNNGLEVFEPIAEKFNCDPIPESEKQEVLEMIFQEKEKRKENETPTTDKDKQGDNSDNIKMVELLANISTYPFLMFSERLKEFKFIRSIAEADRIKKLLIEKDYGVEYRVKIKKGRGSPASYPELSEQGIKLLEQNGIRKCRQYQGKSGFLHALIIHKLIKPFYEKYNTTIIEGKNQGSDCDLGVYGKDRKIAVEVSFTTTPEDEIRNIKRDLNAGFDNVQIIIIGTSLHDKAVVEDEESAISKKAALQNAMIREIEVESQKRVQLLTLKEFRDLT